MIAIPLTKDFSWRNPPLITIGLILINCFIFIVFQHNDDRDWENARQFYHESGLGQLELEFYRVYLAEEGRAASTEEALPPNLSAEDRKAYYFYKINKDSRFINQLSRGEVIPDTDPRFQKWKRLRSEFEVKQDAITTFKYGFRPAFPRAFTLLSCMFLHGSWGHLIGNMIFLWLIGCLIEYGCRHVILPVIYLLGGMAGTALFWLINPGSTIPLVGASGAIAGLMGAFTVFYGLKKVRIFLNLGFYFNYLTFPAIFLLPLWMGNELFQLLFDTFSPVAYAAHFGGLGFGALLAFGARTIPGCLDEDGFNAAEEDRVAPLLEAALAHMGQLKFVEARELLETILTHEPDHLAALQHLHTIDRQKVDHANYHQTAARLLTLLCQQPEHFDKACAMFREYTQTAKPPKLSADLYMRVSQCFAATGKLPEAQHILYALVKKNAQLSELPMALLKLARGFRQNNATAEWLHCLKVLQHHFPMSSEAQIAVEDLRNHTN